MSGWLPALWISPGTESGALGKREADRPDPRVVAPEVSGSRGDRAWGWVQGSGGLASWSRCRRRSFFLLGGDWRRNMLVSFSVRFC